MKKKLITLLFVLIAIGVKHASAQTGVNNNSDWKVPVPVTVIPRASIPNLGAAFVRIAIPPVPPITNFSSSGVLPGFPATPTAPVLSSFTAAAGTPNITIYPTIPNLPPILPVSPIPQLRLIF